MNIPDRMPVISSSDPIRTHWLIALIGVDVACGLACVLAPVGDAGPILLRTAGGLLLVAAILVSFGFSVTGGVIGSFGWGALVAAVLFSTVHWTALAFVVLFVVGWSAACHALVMYDVGSGLDRDRERRQRR